MKKRATVLAALAVLICLTCTGCTSAFSNAEAYFSNSRTIMSNLLSSGTPNTAKERETAIPLDAPTDFSIDEAGNYAFTGVADADYYLLYFCAPDTAEDSDDFLFSSEPIPAHTGSDSYTGYYRDVINVAYGEYLVRVVAVPALGDETRSMSKPASVSYQATGTQSQPRFEYFWDPFVDVLSLQLANVGDYTYEAIPAQVKVTITNVDNENDSVLMTLEGIAEGNTELSTNALTEEASYRISAVAISDSPYVTNETTDEAVVEEALELGALNILTGGYSYSHGWMSYPLIWENFDLAEGGPVGELVSFEEYTFECTPVAPNSGSTYSYTFVARPFVIATGTLELYEDGTAQFANRNSPPLDDSAISGIWIDNGDGTATLCFSHTTWAPM